MVAKVCGAGQAGVIDDDAFTTEALAVIPHLRGFARSLCKSASFADDLVQEALLRAWKARARFVPGTGFKAWTFVILRNAYFSHLRHQKYERGWQNGLIEEKCSRPSQEGHVALLEVREALMEISHDRREALLLVGGAGMSYDEAAEICGCPVGTIKSRVSRARNDLQRLLDCGGADALEN